MKHNMHLIHLNSVWRHGTYLNLYLNVLFNNLVSVLPDLSNYIAFSDVSDSIPNTDLRFLEN
jgi:hypothetical protein